MPLSNYYKTPGQKETVTLPFKDFTNRASGNGTFDFKHLKDWTMTTMKPFNQPFVFSNMKLVGGGPGCGGSNVSTSPSASPSATESSGASPTETGSSANSESGGASAKGVSVFLGTLGFIYFVFAF